MEIIIVSVLWYLIGVVLFIRWWTKALDFTNNSDLLGYCFLVAGLMGPITYLITRSIENEKPKKEPRILFKNRRKNK